MTRTPNPRPKNLGEVEQAVLEHVWAKGPCTAEDTRAALADTRPMKESTVRTVLRRLEEKGYVSHTTEGRTFIFRASQDRQNVAVRAVRSIIDRFCGGSAEELLIGMVDHEVLDRKQLERLTRRITEQKKSGETARRKSNEAGKTKEGGK
jgi:BlaI family penicillinase repressor